MKLNGLNVVLRLASGESVYSFIIYTVTSLALDCFSFHTRSIFITFMLFDLTTLSDKSITFTSIKYMLLFLFSNIEIIV